MGEHNLSFNVSNLSNGVYFIKLNSADGQASQKIVVAN